MPKLILSPVGTSLLTNNIEPNFKSELYKFANKKENEISEELLSKLQSVEKNIKQELNKDSIFYLKKTSAELNGILGIYQNSWHNAKNDMHFLLATDTYQGRLAAGLLKDYLTQKTQSAELIIPENLNTKTKEDFKTGIRDLLKWCDEVLPEYKEAGYEIIFNLTGGFKSLQGYLNTIAMFYADSISYIFEGEDELITIPKLPIKIESEEFERNASVYLQLGQTEKGIDKEKLL